MFPISELGRLDLKQHGLSLTPEEIFNPASASLVDGICRVNGCTGSFVSDQGLIITNHHCAYDAIQKGSTPSKDLLAEGFVASSKKDEIPAPGYVVRITEQYRDVSEKVLDGLDRNLNSTERAKAIELRRKEIEKEAEEEHPGLRAEVAEMFLGKTYVLFLYTYLKDVRLVFAPPESVGAFGGDIDNWEWPRHTGDFAFMRAYTAPDGTSAEYSSSNIPYRPKRPIRVAPKGVEPEDFVFILGYPGRTLRQRTASYFRYEAEMRLPAIVDYAAWQMREMEAAWGENREVEIQLATRYKSLANVEKRSRGQVQGLHRTRLIDKRIEEERALANFINADSERKSKYGDLISQIDQEYERMTSTAKADFAVGELKVACRAFAFAFVIVDAVHEFQKKDLERETPYMERNLPLTKQQLKNGIGDWHKPTDAIIHQGMIKRLKGLPQGELPAEIDAWLKGIPNEDAKIDAMFAESRLGEDSFAMECLGKTPSELKEVNDPFLQVMLKLYPAYVRQRDLEKGRDALLGGLYRELQDVRMLYQGSAFVPDANGTLRLTYGHIRGDSPADAITRSPITTFRGVLEKTTSHVPFNTPKLVLDRYAGGVSSEFRETKSQDIPVCILYSADTTGGNSGSPVMNGQGELVGVNFDRTFEATINDFAWNGAYSRSIGVDIRYVLWLTGEVYGGNHLLEEMGVR